MPLGFVTVQLETLRRVFPLPFFSCFSRSAAIAVALELGSPTVDSLPWGCHAMVSTVSDLSLLPLSKIDKILLPTAHDDWDMQKMWLISIFKPFKHVRVRYREQRVLSQIHSRGA